MEEKKPTTEDRRHEVRPEHKLLRDAMAAWSNEAADSESRSAILLQVITKDDELRASSHLHGDCQHLAIAVQACMSDLSPDNPVGTVLRAAAVRSLTAIGMIAPHEQPENDGVPEEQQPGNN